MRCKMLLKKFKVAEGKQRLQRDRGIVLSDVDGPPSLSTRVCVVVDRCRRPVAGVGGSRVSAAEAVQGDVDPLAWRRVDQPRTGRKTDPGLQGRQTGQEPRVRTQRLTAVQRTDLRRPGFYYIIITTQYIRPICAEVQLNISQQTNINFQTVFLT